MHGTPRLHLNVCISLRGRVFLIYLKLYERATLLCVCAWILQLGERVHVHYIRRSVRGAPQRECTAVCSELSAPAGCAIPIYPSAVEVGGKSAGQRCRRFHIRGTRLPVRGPLCGGDEGGRLQGHSVRELGLLGDGGGGWKGGRQ